MDQKLPFLDVLVDRNNSKGLITLVFHKKMLSGLLLNFFSFTSFSYKLGLVRTLVDRTFIINNTWLCFHYDIENLIYILKKNLFSSHLIKRVIDQYLSKIHKKEGRSISTSHSSQNVQTNVFYFKLPYTDLPNVFHVVDSGIPQKIL